MKRAIIFLNGNRPSRDLVFQTIKTTDTIICANGGSKHALALGVIPHIVIGDQDSLSQSVLKELKKHPITWISHPKEKDETDSELAIQYAIDQKFLEIILLGVLGSRFDHALGTLLFLATRNSSIIRIIEGKQEMYIVRDSCQVRGEKGEVVSIIPLISDAKGVTTRGLKWKLDNATLVFGKTRGLSNEMLSNKASVLLRKGVLLVVHNKR